MDIVSTRLKSLVKNSTVLESLHRMISGTGKYKDRNTILRVIFKNNGNVYVKQPYPIAEETFNKKLFKGVMSNIYISDKIPNLALKKKKNVIDEDTFIGEVVVGQYLNFYTPEYVNACIQFLGTNTYVIRYSNSIDLIEYCNANFSVTKKTVKIIQNVIKAVSEVHKAGVVHNDIKLENLIVNQSTLNVKLIDFENSFFCEYPQNRQVGTLIYMCPLLACDRILKIKRSKYTDIYSLVISIFYILEQTGSQFKIYPITRLQKMSDRMIYKLHLKRISTVRKNLKDVVSEQLLNLMIELLRTDTLVIKDPLMDKTNEYLEKLSSLINKEHIYIYKSFQNSI